LSKKEKPRRYARSDRGEVGAAEDRAAVVDAVGAQFVDLRPISAVVEHADQQLEPMALDRLEFLDVHQ
jgi:hypothetical protein